MTRFLAPVLVAVSCGFAGAHPQETAQSPVRKVRIDFPVVDRKGEPVRDLKQDEIEVWIGHFRVPIETFAVVSPGSEGRSAGRTIVLLLDDVTLSPAVVPRARDAARLFLGRMLPGDRLSIVTLTGTTSETASEPARLRAALDRYNVRATGIQRLDQLSEHVLQTIAELSRQMIEAPGVRKTIVAIGSGAVFDRPLLPPGIGRDVEPQWIDAMRALSFSHTHLYVIDPSGVGATPADGGQNGFAHASGGHAFLNTNDPRAAVDQILRDGSNYYVITVGDPPIGRKSDLRELEIRVKRPGLTAIAPRAIPGGS